VVEVPPELEDVDPDDEEPEDEEPEDEEPEDEEPEDVDPEDESPPQAVSAAASITPRSAALDRVDMEAIT
jgi:hypothetical protein